MNKWSSFSLDLNFDAKLKKLKLKTQKKLSIMGSQFIKHPIENPLQAFKFQYYSKLNKI